MTNFAGSGPRAAARRRTFARPTTSEWSSVRPLPRRGHVSSMSESIITDRDTQSLAIHHPDGYARTVGGARRTSRRTGSKRCFVQFHLPGLPADISQRSIELVYWYIYLKPYDEAQAITWASNRHLAMREQVELQLGRSLPDEATAELVALLYDYMCAEHDEMSSELNPPSIS